MKAARVKISLVKLDEQLEAEIEKEGVKDV